MGTVSHIRGSGGAMRKLAERDIDAQIAGNRERYEEAFDLFADRVQLAHRRALSRPSVIPLDSSLGARLIRRMRAFFLSLRSPL
jgi:hypothetical protein